jgi:hypothetical protein
MKKLLAIMVLGLLWSNVAAAAHFDLTECYIKKITDPKYKYLERKSFKEMKNFPDLSKKKGSNGKEFYTPIFFSTYGIFENTQNVKFTEVSFLASSHPTSLVVVTEGKDGETLIYKTGYTILSNTENNVFYGPVDLTWHKRKGFKDHMSYPVINVNEGTIELKLLEFVTEKKMSAFLQCKKKTIKHNKRIKNKKKSDNFNNTYLIILVIIGLINLAGFIYLIRRKK